MRVLVACEYSGTVRDAFIRGGHDAMSCDLLPTESPGPHYQGDLFDVIDYPWDLAVFHPECTHLAVSGARYFAEKRLNGRQQAAAAFFMRLVRRSEHIPMTAIENPVCVMSSLYRKPDQVIQPWMFGHPESKATCLWLKGLPPLEPTQLLDKPESGYWENQTPSGQNKLPPSPDRWKDRARTYQGIADAMAAQWGALSVQP
jgi:hypothetical protein